MNDSVKLENGLFSILSGKVPCLVPEVAPVEPETEEAEEADGLSDGTEAASSLMASDSPSGLPAPLQEELKEKKPNPLEGISARQLFHHIFDYFYTVSEVAELMKVSRPIVLEWIHSGELTAINVGARNRTRWRIRLYDLVEMAKRNVMNLPTHLQRPNDAFAGLVAVWDEELLAMKLVPAEEYKQIQEQQYAEVAEAVQYLRERNLL